MVPGLKCWVCRGAAEPGEHWTCAGRREAEGQRGSGQDLGHVDAVLMQLLRRHQEGLGAQVWAPLMAPGVWGSVAFPAPGSGTVCTSRGAGMRDFGLSGRVTVYTVGVGGAFCTPPQEYLPLMSDTREVAGQVALPAPRSVERCPPAWPLPDPGELIPHPVHCWLGQTARLK